MTRASQQALRRPADRLQALDSPAGQAGGPGYDVLEVQLQVHRRERPQRPQPGLHQGTDGCSICTITQLPCFSSKGRIPHDNGRNRQIGLSQQRQKLLQHGPARYSAVGGCTVWRQLGNAMLHAQPVALHRVAHVFWEDAGVRQLR